MQDFLYLWGMKKVKKSKSEEQPNKRKPIKKNTLYRNFRAWVLHVEHRQMNDTPPVLVRDTEAHVCKHCGTEYSGGYCPKCSMPSRWHRFNWKLLLLNFLDIWGLGNRPMFRTIRDLFWRPGYMIRDYLRGHHLSYFPPFKMTILLMFMIWLMKHFNHMSPQEAGTFVQGVRDSIGDKLSPLTSMIIEQMDRVMDYLDNHMLYRIILQNVLVVLAVKWTFRKVSDFNLVETFFSQIYINCQFHILAFATMLLTWRIPEGLGFFPYMNGLIPAPLVLTYDFHQLYGVTWKQALWKTIVASFKLILLYFIIILVIIAVLFLAEHFTNPNSPLFDVVVD